MNRFASLALAAAMALGAVAPACADEPSTVPASAQVQKDVASIDAILAALYDVISGPAGKERDWNRLRALFAPDGKMRVVGIKDGAVISRAMSVDDYIARNGPLFAKSGFFEREAARTTEVFGQIAHVFSTYEARHASTDAAPFARGINSIQLYNDGSRWWIVSLMWRAEDQGLRLPERYLQSR